MAQIGCTLGFFRKDNCCLPIGKSLKLTPKKTKTQNFSFFTVSTQFCQILSNFVDWNVAKLQQGKNLSTVGLFEEFIAVL